MIIPFNQDNNANRCQGVSGSHPGNISVLLFAVLIVAGGAGLLLYWWSSSRSCSSLSSTIVVGTSPDFPPFAFIEDGRVAGFDIEMIEEIFQRLSQKEGVERSMRIEPMSFSALLPALQTGSLHAVASGITPTADRAKHVLFTKPYIEGAPLVIVTPKSLGIRSLADLVGKHVVVNQGYTADLFMSDQEGVFLTRTKSPADAFLSLSMGRDDAFITAKNTIQPFLTMAEAAKYDVIEIPASSESSAIAVSKTCPELLQQLDRVLAEMEADGTMAQLRSKWGL